MNAPSAEEESLSSVERLYEATKEMAISYQLKPGARVNEVKLADLLGGSRTPLREALNRLVAEGFLTFRRRQGFYCREFQPRDIHELYQFRSVIECAAARLACEHASEEEFDRSSKFLDETGLGHSEKQVEKLVLLDEHFHESIMSMTRNAEMIRVLKNVNARIKFFRWIDMESRRDSTQIEHRQVLDAIRQRDPDLAAERIGAHIVRRMDQITTACKEGYSRIYLVT